MGKVAPKKPVKSAPKQPVGRNGARSAQAARPQPAKPQPRPAAQPAARPQPAASPPRAAPPPQQTEEDRLAAELPDGGAENLSVAGDQAQPQYDDGSEPGEELSFSDDQANADTGALQSSPGGFVPDGYYHLEISEVDPHYKSKNKGTPAIRFIWNVLDGSPADQAISIDEVKDKKVYHDIWITENTMNQVLFWARFLSLVEKGITKFSKSVFSQAMGKQCVCKVYTEPAQDKAGNIKQGQFNSRIDNREVWQPNDEAVAEIPRDFAAMEASGYSTEPSAGDDAQSV